MKLFTKQQDQFINGARNGKGDLFTSLDIIEIEHDIPVLKNLDENVSRSVLHFYQYKERVLGSTRHDLKSDSLSI